LCGEQANDRRGAPAQCDTHTHGRAVQKERRRSQQRGEETHSLTLEGLDVVVVYKYRYVERRKERNFSNNGSSIKTKEILRSVVRLERSARHLRPKSLLPWVHFTSYCFFLSLFQLNNFKCLMPCSHLLFVDLVVSLSCRTVDSRNLCHKFASALALAHTPSFKCV